MPRLAQLLALAGRGLLATMLILVLASGVGLMILHARGLQLLSVQSASMVPVFRPGDALIVEPATAHQLRLGQVISYQSPLNPRLVISHRLIRVNHRDGWLTTRGDAQRAADQSFPPDRVVGRAVAVAPRLGTVLDFSHRPLGLVLVVYLPALGLIVVELQRLWATLQPGIYRL